MAIDKFTSEVTPIETLFEAENVAVHINFFWNSHGKMVPWFYGAKSQKTLSRAKASVKIVKEKIVWDGHIEFERWTLYLNGKAFEGDTHRYHYNPNNNKITIGQTVGWG